MRLALFILLFFALPNARASECARLALKSRVSFDVDRLRKAASQDLLFSHLVESEIVPSLNSFSSRLPASADETGVCKAAASEAPEWGQYGEVFFQARVQWKELREKLPALRESKALDDEVLCRLRRSIASTSGVLTRFKTACERDPASGSCKKPKSTQALEAQRSDLEAKLRAGDSRFREKWGKELHEKLACR